MALTNITYSPGESMQSAFDKINDAIDAINNALAGGVAGQALIKQSGTDFDFAVQDLPATAKVSANDTTPNYLSNKISAGVNIDANIVNPGANEILNLDVVNGLTTFASTLTSTGGIQTYAVDIPYYKIGNMVVMQILFIVPGGTFTANAAAYRATIPYAMSGNPWISSGQVLHSASATGENIYLTVYTNYLEIKMAEGSGDIIDDHASQQTFVGTVIYNTVS